MGTPEKPAAAHPLGNVSVLGIPFDEHESFLRGPAQAPTSIRLALHEGSMNLWTENGIDLEASAQWRDGGDVGLGAGDDPFERIETAVAAALERGERVLSLGGDHSVTYPILRAYAQRYKRLTILHLDAHPDLYEEFEGNRFSHACPFARIMEEQLATRLVQVGIRTIADRSRSPNPIGGPMRLGDAPMKIEMTRLW